MNYAVIGASGNTGRCVAEALLKQGKKVRVIGRTAEKLRPLARSGAETCVGPLADKTFLSQALEGVGALYAMLPPDMTVPDVRAYYGKLGESIASAVSKADVRYVVALSSQGADLPARTGPIAGLYDQEQRLNGLKDVHVVHLRAGFFMENLLNSIPTIRAQGIVVTPLRGDLPMAMIATRDIGKAAADRLLALDFAGHTVHDLLGQRDVSMTEATRIIGNAIDRKDLRYVQAPYDQAEQGMIQAGLSAGVARTFVEMYRAFNEGLIRFPARSAQNTTSTRIEEFAGTFAASFRKPA